MKHFSWKLKRALPVGERLLERNIDVDPKCKRCDCNESIIHLFFQCQLAQKIWHLAPLTSEVDYRGIIDLMSVWPSLCSQKCLPLTGILAGSLVPWILWAIWKAKNRFVFEGFYATPEDTLSSAIILAREWSNNCKPEPAVNKRSFRQIPEARSETMIVRSDAAWNSTSRKQG